MPLESLCLKQIGHTGGKHEASGRIYDSNMAPTVLTDRSSLHYIPNKIRRLTPRECFRLQDFPDSFTWPVSDSQAYKQAGNSITVAVLYNIVKKLRTNNS